MLSIWAGTLPVLKRHNSQEGNVSATRQVLSPQLFQVQQAALQLLIDFKAVMYGPNCHFDYGNSFHGTTYINPHQIFGQPPRVWQLLHGLITQHILPASVVAQTEIVMGPERGGAKLAGWMQGPIDSQHPLTDSRVEVAELHKNPDGIIFIPEFFRQRIRGKRVLLVDDVRNTGETFWKCADCIRGAGGTLIATTVLYDRVNLQPEFQLFDKDQDAIPHYPLTECQDQGDIWPEKECPLCRLGDKPITQF